MKPLRLHAAILISFLSINDVFALGAVSRACQFRSIPTALKAPAVLFFRAVGAPASVLSLPDADARTQSESWILESITTDYVETRYYLYAQTDIYYSPTDENPWTKLITLVSPGWGASRISRAMQEDDRLKKFYANRGPLYSARAGYPEIVTRMPHIGYGVVGAHWAYDPSSKRTYAMQDTYAFDCNLGKFGLEGGGIFDW